MSTWYAQSSGNIDAVGMWKDLAGTTTLTWPAASGDILAANGKTVTINVDFDIGTGRISTAAEGGTAGGGFSVTTVRALTSRILAGTSACVVQTGSSSLDVTGIITGGTATNACGVRNDSTGHTGVVGSVIGGSGDYADGIYNTADAPVPVVGNVTAGGNLSAGVRSTSTRPIGISDGNIDNTLGPAVVGIATYDPGVSNYIIYPTAVGVLYHYPRQLAGSRIVYGEVHGDITGDVVVPTETDVKAHVAYGSLSSRAGLFPIYFATPRPATKSATGVTKKDMAMVWNHERKLGRLHYVTDFGAVGDGVTDDTVAVQAAIDSFPAYGGRLHFPTGRYIISKWLSGRSYMTYSGDGWSSQFCLAPNLASMNMWNLSGVTDVTISDLFFDGNRARQDPAMSFRGISPSSGSDRLIIERCRFDGFRGDGAIHASCAPTTVVYGLKIANCVFTNVGAVIIGGANKGGGAIVLNKNVRRCEIVHNYIDCDLDQYVYGIQVEPDPTYTDNNIKIKDNFIRGSGAAIGVLTDGSAIVEVSDNIISGITAGVAIQVIGPSSVKVKDNFITDPYSASVGIRVSSNNAYTNMLEYSITGNEIVEYGTSTEGAISIIGSSGKVVRSADVSHNMVILSVKDGIKADYADDLKVDDNTVRNCGANGTGINLANCADPIVTNNRVKGTATTAAGIALDTCADWTLRNNNVTHNTGASGIGVLMDTCTPIPVEATLAVDNVLHDNTDEVSIL